MLDICTKSIASWQVANSLKAGGENEYQSAKDFNFSEHTIISALKIPGTGSRSCTAENIVLSCDVHNACMRRYQRCRQVAEQVYVM